MGGDALLLPRELGGDVSALSLEEASDLSLTADVGADSGLLSPGATAAGELSVPILERKSA